MKKSKSKKSSGKKDKRGFAQPSAKVLADLATMSDNCRSRSQSASGQIGQAIKEAAAKKNLNPAAFKMVNRLRQIGEDDPIKLRGILDHFDAYRKTMKVDALKAAHMLPVKAKKSPAKSRSSGGLKAIGEAAANVANKAAPKVVPLASAMKDAIDADKKKSGEMQAA